MSRTGRAAALRRLAPAAALAALGAAAFDRPGTLLGGTLLGLALAAAPALTAVRRSARERRATALLADLLQAVATDAGAAEVRRAATALAGGPGPSVLGTRLAPLLDAAVAAGDAREALQARADQDAHAAAHDTLTGLPNRAQLHAELEAATAGAATHGGRGCLLLVDLDRFKEVNDTLGHAAGDVLLRAAASRLQGALRGDARVARIGGDEFAVLLPRVADAAAGDAVAERLLAALREPLDVEGVRLAVGASVGVAPFGPEPVEVAELLRRADAALYAAKGSRGRARRWDDAAAAEGGGAGHARRLREALAAGLVEAALVPQVSLRSGRTVGVEALGRWDAAEGPGPDLVALADGAGLARPLAAAVLEAALRSVGGWLRADPERTLSLNLSPRNVLDRQLPAELLAVVARHGVRPAALVVETTERAVTADVEVAAEVLGELAAAGVQLSLDDYGTGFSSVQLLQRLGIGELKVHGGFVATAGRDRAARAVVVAAAGLGRELGLRVVADGVMDPAVRALLRELGCDRWQGPPLGDGEAVIDLSRLPGPRRSAVAS